MVDFDVNSFSPQPDNGADWYLSVRLGHARMDAESGALHRPHILLLLDQQGNVLAHCIKDHAFSLEQVWLSLADAIADQKRPPEARPLRLHFDQPELLAGLASRLDAAGILAANQSHAPEIERALVALERGFDPPVLLPPALATTPYVTPDLQGRIYQNAAELYRLAPWRVLPVEAPFEVEFPEHGPARWVVVMGSGGDVFGISVNDSLLDLERMYAGGDPMELACQVSWLALTFDTAEYLAFEDLDAIRVHGWTVDNENAYPALYRVGGPQADLLAPTAEDLSWLDVVLPALRQYFEKQPVGDACWNIPHESRVVVDTPAGPMGVLVRYPCLENS